MLLEDQALNLTIKLTIGARIALLAYSMSGCVDDMGDGSIQDKVE